MPENGLKQTPLFDLHQELGARMVPFAGYAMPVQYPTGILKEHAHTREKAGLFDVSHMGQAFLAARKGDPAALFERLVPGDIQALKPGAMRYTMLLNDAGGILDDLMVTRFDGERLYLVVNAAMKDADFAHIQAALGNDARLEVLERGLLALQGPLAGAVLARLAPEVADIPSMHMRVVAIDGVECYVSRSGYTGEDGFEISVPAEHAVALARRLLAEPEVAPIGLGARDSLRLEAGLCLYGHDITPETTPIEAGLAWAVNKRRRAEGNFPGARIILDMIENGAPRRRVGIRPEGRVPAREGTEILDSAGQVIGHVTSGGFGPTVNGPVAMGYVPADHAAPGTALGLRVRDKVIPARVVPLPFVEPRRVRAKS